MHRDRIDMGGFNVQIHVMCYAYNTVGVFFVMELEKMVETYLPRCVYRMR